MIAYIAQFLPELGIAITGALVVAMLIVGAASAMSRGNSWSGGGAVVKVGAAVPVVVVIAIVFAVMFVRAVAYAGIAHGVDIHLVNRLGDGLFPVAVFANCVPGLASILVAGGRSRVLRTIVQLVIYSVIAGFFVMVIISSGFGMPEGPDEYTVYPTFEVARVLFPAAGALVLTFIAWLSLAPPTTASRANSD